MDKRIGSFLLLCLFSLVSYCSDPSIQLYVQDMHGSSIKQAEVGVPFLLQVVVDNIANVQSLQDIPGGQDFNPIFVGSTRSASIVGGHRIDRVILNYQLTSMQKGSYTLGPVVVKTAANQEVISRSIVISVGDESVAYNVKRKNFFLQIEFDQKSVYLGQKVVAKLRFYHVDPVEKVHISLPNFQDMHVSVVSQEPISGQEVIADTAYHYSEWTMHVYPQKIGTVVFPSVQAVFTLTNTFGAMGIFDIFGMGSEKAVQSSPRSLQVQELPEHDTYKNVSAIGSFQKASLFLQKKKAEVGEGIVATIKVVGNGNIDVMMGPELVLPDGLKYYASNSTVAKMADDLYEKSFEYIIQAQQPGEFSIPSQQFIYFDLEKQAYKYLRTNALSLHIIGEAIKEEEAQGLSKDIGREIVKNYKFSSDQIDVVYNSLGKQPTHGSFDYMLYVLVLCCMMMLAALGIPWIYGKLLVLAGEKYWLQKRYLAYRARRLLKKQDLYGLYKMLTNLLREQGVEELERGSVVDLLKKSGFSETEIQNWKQFIARMHRIFFEKENDLELYSVSLSQQAVMWIEKFLSVFYS